MLVVHNEGAEGLISMTAMERVGWGVSGERGEMTSINPTCPDDNDTS